MVVKKQLKKISKKILILGLATSIIFMSCFSTKKIDTKAMGLVATITAWTAYDICLYLGSIALGALGVGAIYESRDDIAKFGKAFVDHVGENMENNPDSWIFGSYNDNGSTVYGPEVFEVVGSMAWDYIAEGGLTPSTLTDLNGDGYVDISDKDFELENSNFWTTSNGAEYLKNQIIGLYNDYILSGTNSLLGSTVTSTHTFHKYNDFVFTGLNSDDLIFTYDFVICGHDVRIISKDRLYIFYEDTHSYTYSWRFFEATAKPGASYQGGIIYIDGLYYSTIENFHYKKLSDMLPFSESDLSKNSIIRSPWVAYNYGEYSTLLNKLNSFDLTEALGNCIFNGHVSTTDWSGEAEQMAALLGDICNSLRSLQDIADMCSAITTTVADMTDSMDIINDLVAEVVGTYNPVIDVVIPTPVPWNPDITRPITATDLPRDITADTDLPMPDGPNQDDNDDDNDFRIDLPSITIMFDIIYLAVMIIVMLLLVFLACLAFIVMIFRIPASSSMLPPDMVLGFEHLDEIMIPIMNISIYDFAMALIYLLIVFTVIKILRLEINDYGVPRSGKKGG